MILKELDPEGVAQRSKKRLKRRRYSVPGPDFLWHIDGHDKLKPYGFSIHGCNDGFLRKTIWFKVDSSNKGPEIIAGYFISVLKKINGLPCRIRSDDGTENYLIEALQISIRSNHSDEYAGLGSFLVWTSPTSGHVWCKY